MKKFKLILTVLITIISIQVSSQISVITQNTSAPAICNGSACLDSTAVGVVNQTSIYWAGGGAILQQGTYCIDSLCAGTYTVTYSVNGNSMTSTFTIGSGSVNPCAGLTASLSIQSASSASSCDGAATCIVTGGAFPYSYLWSNGETPNTASNLCAVSYICCTVTDANGCTSTICDSISFQGQTSGGDTLIISGNGGCNNSAGSIVMQIEDCTFDFNAVDTAYLSTVVLGSNPTDSSTVLWIFVDTNGVSTTITSVSPGFNANGCYDYTLILFCSQKSMNIKYIFVNGHFNFQNANIESLTNTPKELVKILDLSGRVVTNDNANGILIYHYSDGSHQKVFVWKGN
jgi:hypothetical protein